jgi:hypothetical protein
MHYSAIVSALILSFFLPSAYAESDHVSGTISAAGKQFIVVTLDNEQPSYKAGQVLSLPDGNTAAIKEIEGNMVVLKKPENSSAKVGDKIELTYGEPNEKAQALLEKNEKAAEPAPIPPAAPVPPPPQAPTPSKTESKPATANRGNKYFGVLLGDGIQTSGGHDNFFVFGARAGGDLIEYSGGTLSAGLIFETKGESVRVGSTSADARCYIYELELLSRHIAGTALYSGVRAGVGVLSVEINSPSQQIEGTGVSFIGGPVLGAEVPVGERTNFNIDLSWIYASPGDLDVGSTTYPYSDSSAFLMQVGLQFDWR